MEIKYEKDLTQLNRVQLREDRNLQQWLLHNVRHMRKLAVWYLERAEERTENSPQDSVQDYIHGLIDDEEYSKRSGVEKRRIGKNKWVEEMWMQRIEWCDYAEVYLEASLASIDDALIDYEKEKPKKPRKNKGWYGYNPRVNASKNNPRPKGKGGENAKK